MKSSSTKSAKAWKTWLQINCKKRDVCLHQAEIRKQGSLSEFALLGNMGSQAIQISLSSLQTCVQKWLQGLSWGWHINFSKQVDLQNQTENNEDLQALLIFLLYFTMCSVILDNTSPFFGWIQGRLNVERNWPKSDLT